MKQTQFCYTFFLRKPIMGGDRMNKKIGFIVITTLFIVTFLFSASLTFAQRSWDSCIISAYGTNLDEYNDSTTNTERYEFTVANPPSGSEITNTIEVINYDSGENFTETLSAGQRVYVNYLDAGPTLNTVNAAAESGYFIIEYDGYVTGVTINNIDIPEFSSIIILPLFITATLLAIVYKRKRTSQNRK